MVGHHNPSEAPLVSEVVSPIARSSFSETLGRRTIYVISFGLFVVFGVLSAISTSISMLIVFRILGGGAAASVQSVGAGTVADVWEPFERGRAMGKHRSPFPNTQTSLLTHGPQAYSTSGPSPDRSWRPS